MVEVQPPGKIHRTTVHELILCLLSIPQLIVSGARGLVPHIPALGPSENKANQDEVTI